MGKLKDDPKSRLERLAQTVKSEPITSDLYELFGLGEPQLSKFDWENKAIRTAAALDALALDLKSATDGPLKIAFEKFNLSPENPYHWRELLTFFAFAHFGPKSNQGGPPKTWTAERLCQLLYDIAVKRQKKPSKFNAPIFRLLIADRSLKSRYSEETTDSLKDAYRNAKDPDCNETLALIRDATEQFWWSQARHLNEVTGAKISDERFARFIPDLSLRSAIQHIETKWPTLNSYTKR